MNKDEMVHGEKYYYRYGLVFYFIGFDPKNKHYGYFKNFTNPSREPWEVEDISWLEIKDMQKYDK